MNTSPQFRQMAQILMRAPDARAVIRGGGDVPDISGAVNFYQTRNGVLLAADICGLPRGPEPCGGAVFGFHIHEGASCTGNAADPFADTGEHYNPHGCEHPRHAGDLPPLFGNRGRALMTVLTDRFTLAEIIGRTVLIHSSPDDFTTQPAGNSGKKIACGTIRRG